MRKLAFFIFIFTLNLTDGFASTFKTILLTGGTGYIGSHIAVELLNKGYHVVIVDNLMSSKAVVLGKIKKITGKNKELTFYNYDVRDKPQLEKVFTKHKIDAVIHLAGLKAVGESVEKPLLYFTNNLISTLYLAETMEKFGVHNIVFSSSATVYGMPHYLPLDELHPLSVLNPYGRTKLQLEEILEDVTKSDPKWRVISLRYFNPSGAHSSGLIGEDPQGIPNNLMPYILQIVVGKREKLRVFGGDYDTSKKDGTGVRDYIHVVDLAQAHLATLHKLENDEKFAGYKYYNIGTGTGYSVLEILNAVSEAAGKKIPYEIVDRRPGDAGEVFADPSLADKELHWKAKLGIKDMARDSLKWIQQNPDGYATPKLDKRVDSSKHL